MSHIVPVCLDMNGVYTPQGEWITPVVMLTFVATTLSGHTPKLITHTPSIIELHRKVI